ncbi:ATP-binding cassette domain-containing protein [Sphaerisporangium sp. NPDC049002]|uniref:ATP-binding cassette domain-containing protein n=1 Tax=Sphaerisporangium sp. NPDC049002 TaxID=3155392 RepID=UPI0034110EAE
MSDPRPLLQLQKVKMQFGGVVALREVELTINEGEIFALIGPNGAGKTTVFNVVTGVYRPTSGQVVFDGDRIDGMKRFKVTKRGVARTFQNIRLFHNMSALENVMVGADAHHRAGMFSAALGLPWHRHEERDGKALARELLEFVGIGHRAEETAKNLPYGDQRRLEIARALATKPKLLLLDEPAAGSLTWVEERQAVITRPYVTIQDPEDLRGRRLGLPLSKGVPVDVRRATALRGFQGALWAGGLTLNDVHLVDVPVTPVPGWRTSVPAVLGGPRRASTPAGLPGAGSRQWEPELEALARGDIDAVYVKGATAVEAAARYGLHVAIDLDGHPDQRVRINDGTVRPITVDQLLLDVRPDVVARFLRVLLDAAEWASAYPDQALTLSGDAARPPGAHRLTDLTIDLPDLTIDLSAERLGLLAEQERFLWTHGFLESAVDVGSWADHTPLASAHARRRTYQEQTA